ncbi:MAG TPA: hypothetical protein PK264_18870 [Hyphomicrobiaceae bacterium]|nr:hypothetical protein [Hyphomicrobiaceae bacterium]
MSKPTASPLLQRAESTNAVVEHAASDRTVRCETPRTALRGRFVSPTGKLTLFGVQCVEREGPPARRSRSAAE